MPEATNTILGPTPTLTVAAPRQGWQCPLCRTVYSPDVMKCTCNQLGETFPPLLPQRWGALGES